MIKQRKNLGAYFDKLNSHKPGLYMPKEVKTLTWLHKIQPCSLAVLSGVTGIDLMSIEQIINSLQYDFNIVIEARTSIYKATKIKSTFYELKDLEEIN